MQARDVLRGARVRDLFGLARSDARKSVEFFRFTIVRQVKRWKIVLNNNNINKLLAQPEEPSLKS